MSNLHFIIKYSTEIKTRWSHFARENKNRNRRKSSVLFEFESTKNQQSGKNCAERLDQVTQYRISRARFFLLHENSVHLPHRLALLRRSSGIDCENCCCCWCCCTSSNCWCYCTSSNCWCCCTSTTAGAVALRQLLVLLHLQQLLVLVLQESRASSGVPCNPRRDKHGTRKARLDHLSGSLDV